HALAAAPAFRGSIGAAGAGQNAPGRLAPARRPARHRRRGSIERVIILRTVALHLLIVAVPYEAEILRRAAARAGHRTTVFKEGDLHGLPDPVDAVIISSNLPRPAELCAALRAELR